MMKRIFLTALTGLCFFSTLFAQPPVRTEDHFWRKRVVNRISLIEKINVPLTYHEGGFYQGDPRFREHDGIVASLINGVKKGLYQAIHPDNWDHKMDYEELALRMREFEQSLEIPVDDWGADEEPGAAFSEADAASEWGDETEWAISTEDEWASPFDEEAKAGEIVTEQELDLGAYEEVIHMVEDWIFDKNTSAMVYQIDFFEVIWSDPTGMLPEKVLARFMYKDVRQQLEQTQWKNRFNDAQALSMREVFELRLFNSYVINVGGEPVRTLQEAKRRRDEMIEFEHHLWSY